eukprot:sb/3473907/
MSLITLQHTDPSLSIGCTALACHFCERALTLATMEVKVRNVERTDEHLNDRLNKCLLFMERGRHEQVVKPYYHGPGKPLTPYQTRRDREAMEEETRREELLEKSKKGVFLRFSEPRRFSAGTPSKTVPTRPRDLGRKEHTGDKK